MIATFLLIGIIFIPIGIAVIVSSGKVVELETRYDNLRYGATEAWPAACRGGDPCVGDAKACPNITDVGYEMDYTNSPVPAKVAACSFPLDITITESMAAPVYVYYKLSNFYQNHRRYVKSRSDSQLSKAGSVDTSTCDPLETDKNGKQYYPCGLIAGSFFVDRFSASVLRAGAAGPQVLGNWSHDSANWQKEGIAWATDKKEKFKFDEVKYKDPNYNQSEQQQIIHITHRFMFKDLRSSFISTHTHRFFLFLFLFFFHSFCSVFVQ